MIIINHKTKKVIFECEKETVREAILEAMKSDANLRGANLSNADLSGAGFYYANLRYANLSNADLSGADLTGISIEDTYFEKTKLIYKNKLMELTMKEIKENS